MEIFQRDKLVPHFSDICFYESVYHERYALLAVAKILLNFSGRKNWNIPSRGFFLFKKLVFNGAMQSTLPTSTSKPALTARRRASPSPTPDPPSHSSKP